MIRVHAPRAGFTLIEVLVVVAVIAMLAAITASGISRVRISQMSRNTEHTVTKLQLALDQKMQAIADQVALDRRNKRIPSEIVNGCNDDTDDRAAAVWMYMNARRDLPNTFAEAWNSVNYSVTIGTNTYTKNLQPRTTFTSNIPNPAITPTSLGVREQAAVLLYMILADTDSRGANFNADDATSGAQGTISDGSSNYRVFVDAWRTPITFIRFGWMPNDTDELNQAPYIGQTTSKDPFDPKLKIKNWPNNSVLKNGNNGVFTTGWNPANSTASDFDGKNRQPAVIAAGPNKVWDSMFDMDNIVGYRLRRQGARGD
jgi:prepilin-type N-terminal cleavage/methylation domain-containing protein